MPYGQTLAIADPCHGNYWPLLCCESELRGPCNFYLVPISLSIEKAGYPNVLCVGTWYSFESYLAVN